MAASCICAQVQRAVAARRKASYGRISVKSKAEALVATGAALPQVSIATGLRSHVQLSRCYPVVARPIVEKALMTVTLCMKKLGDLFSNTPGTIHNCQLPAIFLSA